MSEPSVTIIVVPRERFSYARESLESVLNNTNHPYSLIYVDGGSPRPLKNWIEQQARRNGFRLLRTDHYLSPNEARNMGVREATGKYVVFVDNDVHVTPGWLSALVRCAEQSNAWLVGPVYCVGPLTDLGPDLETIHVAGGDAGISDDGQRRKIYEYHHFAGERLSDVRSRLASGPTEVAEFHCALIRRDAFDRLGPLDEGFMSTRDHIDFCLSVMRAGGSIWLEPDAVISYVTAPQFARHDIPFYLLRWSEVWNRASLSHANAKWGLNDDYVSLHETWLRPQRQLALRPQRDWLGRVLGKPLGDRLVNALEWLLIQKPLLDRRRRKPTAPVGAALNAPRQHANS